MLLVPVGLVYTGEECRLRVDLNKIIRAGDYADPALAKMAIEAVEHWRRPEWEGTYHESVTLLIPKFPYFTICQNPYEGS
jgi:hypothetical protein